MKKLFTLFTLLVFAAPSFGQVPGYMGKRFSVYYEPTFGFSFQPKLENDNYKTIVGLNFRNDFSADYAVSKGVALGVSGKIISCKMNDAFYYGDYQQNQNLAFSGDVKVKGTLFSFYIKNFNFRRRGFLAPTGVFSKWEFVYGKIKGSTGDLLPPSSESSGYILVSSIEDLYGGTPEAHLFGVIYSFGRQNILFDKLFLNTSASIGVMTESFAENSIFSGSTEYYGDQSEITSDMQSRVAGSLFLSFTLGIGFLAF